jgi:hypothetical protein
MMVVMDIAFEPRVSPELPQELAFDSNNPSPFLSKARRLLRWRRKEREGIHGEAAEN